MLSTIAISLFWFLWRINQVIFYGLTDGIRFRAGAANATTSRSRPNGILRGLYAEKESESEGPDCRF